MILKTRVLIAAVALLTLVAASAATAQASSRGEDSRSVSGQVVQVRQSTATANEGALTEIKVRTRQQQELWLQLGPASVYGHRYQVGDRIRARVRAENKGDVELVQSIQNLRTREKKQVRSGDGALIPESDMDRDQTRQQDRLKDGTGDGDPDQTRQHDRDRLEDGTGTGDQNRNQSRDRTQSRDRLHQRNGQ